LRSSTAPSISASVAIGGKPRSRGIPFLVTTALAIEMSFVAIGWQVYAIRGNPLDLGFVGDPEHIDTHVLDALRNTDIIPVIAPLGTDESGQTFNINADTVAGSIESRVSTTRLPTGKMKANPPSQKAKINRRLKMPETANPRPISNPGRRTVRIWPASSNRATACSRKMEANNHPRQRCPPWTGKRPKRCWTIFRKIAPS